MTEYKSNSHKSRERSAESLPEKKVEKIITGSAKSKKKSEARKIVDLFLPEGVDDFKSYVLGEVIGPIIRDAILDTVSGVLGVNNNSKPRNNGASRVQYRKYYDDRDKKSNISGSRRGYEYDDIIIDNRGEAEEVLDRMYELLDTYGLVSVADLYDLVGKTANYTDNKYGWDNLDTANVVRAGRDGYMIRLPKAKALN